MRSRRVLSCLEWRARRSLPAPRRPPACRGLVVTGVSRRFRWVPFWIEAAGCCRHSGWLLPVCWHLDATAPTGSGGASSDPPACLAGGCGYTCSPLRTCGSDMECSWLAGVPCGCCHASAGLSSSGAGAWDLPLAALAALAAAKMTAPCRPTLPTTRGREKIPLFVSLSFGVRVAF